MYVEPSLASLSKTSAVSARFLTYLVKNLTGQKNLSAGCSRYHRRYMYFQSSLCCKITRILLLLPVDWCFWFTSIDLLVHLSILMTFLKLEWFHGRHSFVSFLVVSKCWLVKEIGRRKLKRTTPVSLLNNSNRKYGWHRVQQKLLLTETVETTRLPAMRDYMAYTDVFNHSCVGICAALSTFRPGWLSISFFWCEGFIDLRWA